jgi:hypothetical protein
MYNENGNDCSAGEVRIARRVLVYGVLITCAVKSVCLFVCLFVTYVKSEINVRQMRSCARNIFIALSYPVSVRNIFFFTAIR